MLIVVIVVFGEEYLEKTRGADSAGLQGYSKPLLRLGKNPLCSSKEGDIFGEKTVFWGPELGSKNCLRYRTVCIFRSEEGFENDKKLEKKGLQRTPFLGPKMKPKTFVFPCKKQGFRIKRRSKK